MLEKKIGDLKAKENTSIKTLVKNKRSIINLSAMTLNWCVVSFCWYVIGFNVHYFHGNPFINSFLLGLADVGANLLTRAF